MKSLPLLVRYNKYNNLFLKIKIKIENPIPIVKATIKDSFNLLVSFFLLCWEYNLLISGSNAVDIAIIKNEGIKSKANEYELYIP